MSPVGRRAGLHHRRRIAFWGAVALVAFLLDAVLRRLLAARDPIAAALTHGHDEGATALGLLGGVLVIRLLLLFVVPGWGVLVIGSALWEGMAPGGESGKSGKELGERGRPVALARERPSEDRTG